MWLIPSEPHPLGRYKLHVAQFFRKSVNTQFDMNPGIGYEKLHGEDNYLCGNLLNLLPEVLDKVLVGFK